MTWRSMCTWHVWYVCCHKLCGMYDMCAVTNCRLAGV